MDEKTTWAKAQLKRIGDSDSFAVVIGGCDYQVLPATLQVDAHGLGFSFESLQIRMTNRGQIAQRVKVKASLGDLSAVVEALTDPRDTDTESPLIVRPN